MNKTLFLIRHGHALHNELFHKMGVKAFRIPEVIDSPLTQKGIQQAQQLEKEWTNKNEIELVLVSPLTRCLQTANTIFGKTNIPIVCQEFLREYPIGEDTCNMRSQTNSLKNDFSNIDFSDIHLKIDSLWTEERETIEQLNLRIESMIQYIQKRKETKIAIVSHSSYLGQYKDNKIGYIENGDKDLKHCYPYEFKFKI
tara:strand:+ start:840 stop:1433 length:594 start_codon:yes stop_codon:yes gene_type:complete